MELIEIKKKYLTIQKKYSLPAFDYLNQNFEIDKIDRETECLARLIRKVIMEKIVNSISFLELLMNPMNAPRMYMGYVRSLTQDDKKIIEDIYSVLGNISLASLNLEIDYSEKKEAEMINEISSVWESIKPKFRKILTDMKKPNSTLAKKEKSYFG